MGELTRPGPGIMGVHVDPVDYSDVLAKVDHWVRQRKRPAAVIMQTNVLSCVTALDDPAYRQAINNADLSVPDGMPLVWLSRRQGYVVPDRVYGPEMMLRIAALGSERKWRVFLYGGDAGVADKLTTVLGKRFPGLVLTGSFSPPYRDLEPDEDTAICETISATESDVVWVALGGQKQDKWMMEHRAKLSVSVLHGVGAAFDFLTGRVPQAPAWMQDRGLEWAYRLYQEPTRLWRRYLVGNTRFIMHALPEAMLKRAPKVRMDH
jgi:N-acetylglucosaminyldiphosphoundecaprenol N-acetyl-beta-D-mannosaminyltransferase